MITLTLEPRGVAATAASGQPDIVYTVLTIRRVWLRAGPYTYVAAPSFSCAKPVIASKNLSTFQALAT
jgi:hypothetical protein